MVTLIRPEEGTDERLWSGWASPADWPRLTPAVLADRPVVVLAAHPDDEVLGAGGLVRHLAAAGADLQFVWATDGEASHEQLAAPPEGLAPRRREESAAALDLLGAGRSPRRHLGLPDGGLSAHEDDLVRFLRGAVEPGAVLVAPWSGDGHPDHEACGRAAREVSAHVLEYPVWMWSWARPADGRVPWSRMCRVDLDGETRDRKAAAIECFSSQVLPYGPAGRHGPVLPARMLAHFARDHEALLR